MLGTGALVVLLKIKKRKKIIPFDFIDIIKFYISINKVEGLYLRLLFTTLLLQKIS